MTSAGIEFRQPGLFRVAGTNCSAANRRVAEISSTSLLERRMMKEASEFVPFPTVAGGAGNIDQYPVNVGLPFTFGAKTLGPKVSAWLKCFVQNYGTGVLKDYGTYSGFTPGTPVAGLSALQTQVQQTMASSKQSVLWFEALFSTQATTVSQQNAAPLVNGSMAPGAFMNTVQAALPPSG